MPESEPKPWPRPTPGPTLGPAPGPEPFFTVVRGRLDPLETAALTVVLASALRRGGEDGAGSGRAGGGPWRPGPEFVPAGSWRRPR